MLRFRDKLLFITAEKSGGAHSTTATPTPVSQSPTFPVTAPEEGRGGGAGGETGGIGLLQGLKNDVHHQEPHLPLALRYARDGFVSPISVLSSAEAAEVGHKPLLPCVEGPPSFSLF